MSLRGEEDFRRKIKKCEVETVNSKPFLCTVDGIRRVKRNRTATVSEGGGIVANFGRRGRERIGDFEPLLLDIASRTVLDSKC